MNVRVSLDSGDLWWWLCVLCYACRFVSGTNISIPTHYFVVLTSCRDSALAVSACVGELQTVSFLLPHRPISESCNVRNDAVSMNLSVASEFVFHASWSWTKQQCCSLLAHMRRDIQETVFKLVISSSILLRWRNNQILSMELPDMTDMSNIQKRSRAKCEKYVFWLLFSDFFFLRTLKKKSEFWIKKIHQKSEIYVRILRLMAKWTPFM